MNDKYMTISDFAKKVGIARQTVYNSARLKPFIEIIDERKVISARALELYKCKVNVTGHDKENVRCDSKELKTLQKEYNKLYKELESLRRYKAERNEIDKKVLVALERAKADREIKEMLLEQKKKDDVLIQDLLERNRKQADLLEQANIIKALELKKDTQ